MAEDRLEKCLQAVVRREDTGTIERRGGDEVSESVTNYVSGYYAFPYMTVIATRAVATYCIFKVFPQGERVLLSMHPVTNQFFSIFERILLKKASFSSKIRR